MLHAHTAVAWGNPHLCMCLCVLPLWGPTHFLSIAIDILFTHGCGAVKYYLFCLRPSPYLVFLLTKC